MKRPNLLPTLDKTDRCSCGHTKNRHVNGEGKCLAITGGTIKYELCRCSCVKFKQIKQTKQKLSKKQEQIAYEKIKEMTKVTNSIEDLEL